MEFLESISMADVSETILWAAGILGALAILIEALRRILGALFESQTKQVKEKMQEVSEKIAGVERTLSDRMDRVDMESCKNFLVRCLADVERGEQMAETEKERFYEQYEHYIKNDGNSYIKQKVENLQKAGKI